MELELAKSNNESKGANEAGTTLATIPLKFLVGMLLPVEENANDEQVNAKFKEVMDSFINNPEIGQILFDFGQKLTDALVKKGVDTTLLIVPNMLLPIKDKEDADTVDSFIKHMLNAMEEAATDKQNN